MLLRRGLHYFSVAKNGPHRHMSGWSPGVELFERITRVRRCGLVGEIASLLWGGGSRA